MDHLVACPFCAEPLQAAPASAVLGYKLLAMDGLVGGDDLPDQQAMALAVARPIPVQPHE
jgi:hypothetical protein